MISAAFMSKTFPYNMPPFKNKDNMNKTNYRSASILSLFPKVFEKVIAGQPVEY